MSIRNGNIRRDYNEALGKQRISRNMLLISLAAMESYPDVTDAEKVRVAQVLIDQGYTIEYLQLILKQIGEEFFPTEKQIEKLLQVIGTGNYTYKDGVIKNKQLTSINQKELESIIITERAHLSGAELKKYIYDNDLVEEILDILGCERIKYHGKYWSCSNCDGDNPGAINVKNNPYLGVINWTRQKDFNDRADIITLAMYNKKLSFLEAMRFIKESLQIDDKELPRVMRKNYASNKLCEGQAEMEENNYVVLDEKTLEQYEPILHIDWLREGILEFVKVKFGLRFSYEESCIIIPMRHWKTGELIGINKRTTRPKEEVEWLGIPKYKLTSSYPKVLNLYGLYENMESIKEKGYVVVYEAEKSVLKRASRLDNTGVALSGKTMSAEQARILLDLNVDIVISLDNDVNLQEIKELCEYRLYGKTKRRIYYTYDKERIMDVKDSIADLPNSSFERMLNQKEEYTEADHIAYLEELSALRR